MSNFLTPITNWWNIVIKHNPQTIKKLEVVVSAEVPVVKAALVTVIDAYLLTKGFAAGSIPDDAANYVLTFIADAIETQANSVINSVTHTGKV